MQCTVAVYRMISFKYAFESSLSFSIDFVLGFNLRAHLKEYLHWLMSWLFLLQLVPSLAVLYRTNSITLAAFTDYNEQTYFHPGGGGDSTLIRWVCGTGIFNLPPCSGVEKPLGIPCSGVTTPSLENCIVLYCIVLYWRQRPYINAVLNLMKTIPLWFCHVCTKEFEMFYYCYQFKL